MCDHISHPLAYISILISKCYCNYSVTTVKLIGHVTRVRTESLEPITMSLKGYEKMAMINYLTNW